MMFLSFRASLHPFTFLFGLAVFVGLFLLFLINLHRVYIFDEMLDIFTYSKCATMMGAWRFEPLSQLLLRSNCYFFGSNPAGGLYFLSFVISSIILFFAMYMARSFNNFLLFALLFYFSSSFFVLSANLFRQFLAAFVIFLFLLGSRYRVSDGISSFIFPFILASLFHKSTLLLLLFRFRIIFLVAFFSGVWFAKIFLPELFKFYLMRGSPDFIRSGLLLFLVFVSQGFRLNRFFLRFFIIVVFLNLLGGELFARFSHYLYLFVCFVLLLETKISGAVLFSVLCLFCVNLYALLYFSSSFDSVVPAVVRFL